MAEVTGDWVDVGAVIPLRTRDLMVVVAEAPEGGVVITVEGRGEAIVIEPAVAADGAGFSIDVGAYVAAGVR